MIDMVLIKNMKWDNLDNGLFNITDTKPSLQNEELLKGR